MAGAAAVAAAASSTEHSPAAPELRADTRATPQRPLRLPPDAPRRPVPSNAQALLYAALAIGGLFFVLIFVAVCGAVMRGGATSTPAVVEAVPDGDEMHLGGTWTGSLRMGVRVRGEEKAVEQPSVADLFGRPDGSLLVNARFSVGTCPMTFVPDQNDDEKFHLTGSAVCGATGWTLTLRRGSVRVAENGTLLLEAGGDAATKDGKAEVTVRWPLRPLAVGAR
jgi:hypothetical protein